MKSKLFRERKYRFAIALILCISLCVSPMNAFALDSISTEPMLPIPTAEEAAASVSAISYSISPDHLYPFIYDGTAPSSWREIDTANCVIGRLYVHNSNTNQVTPIGQATVTGFTTTKDQLFYVTADQQIIQTDYTGTNHTSLYHAASGEIIDLDYFNGVLNFIEGGNRAVLLDIASRQAATVLNQEGLCSLFFFDDDKFIWRDPSYEPFYYNISTREGKGFDNEHELNCFLAAYIIPTAPESGDVEILSTSQLQNDVILPLTDYPVTENVYSITDTYPSALTYFNYVDKTQARCYHESNSDPEAVFRCKYYAGSRQCDGFARYAHLKYIHREDCESSWPYGSSADGDTDTTEHIFTNESAVKDLFDDLNIGAFVRYGKIKNGACVEQHSAVYCGMANYQDKMGAWFYECNKDWQCGVFYTFYTFEYLASYYHCTKIIVDHTYASTLTNHTKHYSDCVNCSGYLIQSHSGNKYVSSVDATKHETWYACCSGALYDTHTFSYGECTECGYS